MKPKEQYRIGHGGMAAFKRQGEPWLQWNPELQELLHDVIVAAKKNGFICEHDVVDDQLKVSFRSKT